MIFTIAIPTYNRVDLLPRALESLEKQTFRNFEVLVVDDGSTDSTKELMGEYLKSSSFQIRYFYQENGGKHTALNKAIEEGRGDLFLILDSDDWFLPHTLEKLYETWTSLPKHDRNAYSGIMARTSTEDGVLIGKPFPEDPFITSYVDFHFNTGIKKGPFKDCVDFIRMDLLKKYRYPEPADAKFVPEAYITDQIGALYKLYGIPDVLKIVEYQEEGITRNIDAYKLKNAKGMVLYYEILLRKVFLESQTPVPVSSKIYIWMRYLEYQKMLGNPVRFSEISLLGKAVKVTTPFIQKAYKIRKKISS